MLKRKNQKKTIIKEEQGITIVALIITILVLIIISSITITNLVENKFIDTTLQGSENYALSQSNEVSMLNEMNDRLYDVTQKIQEATKNKERLDIEIKIQEASVNGTTIPINAKVEKNGEEVSSGLRYTYRCEKLEVEGLSSGSALTSEPTFVPPETYNEEKTNTSSYSFSGLDQNACYRLTVYAVDGSGAEGSNSVIVLALDLAENNESSTIHTYLRGSLGTTFDDWINSNYTGTTWGRDSSGFVTYNNERVQYVGSNGYYVRVSNPLWRGLGRFKGSNSFLTLA